MEATNVGDERRDRSVSADRAKTVHYARLPRSSREISQPRGDHHKEPPGYTRRRSLTRPRGGQRSGGGRFRKFAGLEFSTGAFAPDFFPSKPPCLGSPPSPRRKSHRRG